MRVEGKRERMRLGVGQAVGGPLTRPLDELESRLRDVLDAMLAINEKMERWERDGGPAGGEVRLRAAGGE